MNISRLFTPETRRSLAAANEDYVSKDTDEYALIEKLKIENNLDRVYRFDIGRNSDGYSELIKEVMDQADLVGLSRANLIDYPDNQYNLLRNHLADQHGLEPSWFVISAGLESMIDHISRVFIKDNIAFLSAVPNFSVFLAFSARMGGRPVYLPVRPEENFQWTHGTVRGLIDLMQKYSPRLLRISVSNITEGDIMKIYYKFRLFCLLVLTNMLFFSLSGCSDNDSAGSDQSRLEGYPIDTDVETTAQRTIAFPEIAAGLQKSEMSSVSRYSRYGYGDWSFGPGLDSDPRMDIMPDDFDAASVSATEQLLNFFTISDPTSVGYPADPDSTIVPMLPSCSYHATLFKQLSPQMAEKLRTLYPAP